MSINNNQNINENINNINEKIVSLIERVTKLEKYNNVKNLDNIKQSLLKISERVNNLSNKYEDVINSNNNNNNSSSSGIYNMSEEFKKVFVDVMQELKYDPVKLKHVVKSIYDMDLTEFKKHIINNLINEDNVIYNICDKLFDQNKVDFIFEVLKLYDIEFADFKNTNLLMKAVAYNDVELAQMIIDRSFMVDNKTIIELLDDHNETCLSYLNFNEDYIDMLQILLDAGVDVNNVNKDGYSMLMFAVESDRKYMAELLLEKMHNEAINYQDEFGNTALHYACIHNNSYMVDLLLKTGANYSLKDNKNKKASQLIEKNSECYELIRKHVYQIIVEKELM